MKKMLMFLIITVFGTASLVFSQQFISIDHTSVDATAIPQEFLDSARTLDVIFGHQSVGNNIIDGLLGLSSQNSARYLCTIIEDPTTTWYESNSGFGHFIIGTNFNPDQKVNGFINYIATGGYGNHVDVAMMKFCYVDFYEEHGWWSNYTGEQVWNMYRPVMESLQSAYPNVNFVWWTCPLHTEYGNHEHEEFNSRVRLYCSANNKILFDLADIESHEPSDNLVLDESGHPALYSGYTTDGGHLNEVGRQRAANAWWWLMARIQGWTGPDSPHEEPPAPPTNLRIQSED